jgi:addiction module HigA family antidote
LGEKITKVILYLGRSLLVEEPWVHRDLEGFRTLIIEPDANARNRLVVVLKNIIFKGQLNYAKTPKDAIEKLAVVGQQDCIIITSTLELDRIKEFIHRAKSTPEGKKSLYLVSLAKEEKDSSSIASMFLRGLDGFICEPYSADEIQDLLLTAKEARAKQESMPDDSSRLAATLDFLVVDMIGHIDTVARKLNQDIEDAYALRSMRETGKTLSQLYEKVSKETFERILVRRFEDAKIPKNYVSRNRSQRKLKVADHPGRIIKEILKARKLSVDFLSGRISINKDEFHRIMNEEAPLTKELAADLSRILGETPSHWLRLQSAYDAMKK